MMIIKKMGILSKRQSSLCLGRDMGGAPGWRCGEGVGREQDT